jgi:hypothetical protein
MDARAVPARIEGVRDTQPYSVDAPFVEGHGTLELPHETGLDGVQRPGVEQRVGFARLEWLVTIVDREERVEQV